jgi:hypothetical protein
MYSKPYQSENGLDVPLGTNNGTQPQRTRNKNITRIKLRIQLHHIPPHSHTNTKTIIYVSSEPGLVVDGLTGIQYIVVGWKCEFLGESVFVFLLGRTGEGNEVLDDEVGAVSKWEKDEDFGASVALIAEFSIGINNKVFYLSDGCYRNQ